MQATHGLWPHRAYVLVGETVNQEVNTHGCAMASALGRERIRDFEIDELTIQAQ